MRAEDYDQLVAEGDGEMICGVCGVQSRFAPIGPTEHEHAALALR
jgi:hypothetical protein